MPQNRVIIELAPSRLTVASVRAGKVVDSRTQRFDRTDWPQPWTSALLELADTLQRFVAELNCVGAQATIIYSAPGALANVTSCPAAAGLANAERAARLALANVADFPIEFSATGATPLLHERPPKNDTTSWIAHNHILAAADAEDRTQPICDWAAQAGLSAVRVVNADALALKLAVQSATSSSEEGVRAVLWIGEHSSVLAAGAPGRLLFVRTIASGIEPIAEALTSPLRSSASPSDTISLSREQARRIFLELGVPAPDEQVPGHPELLGSTLLPHLQPALQRLSIEAKQSLRFGIPELLRGSVRLSIAGVGASVPRLGEVIARAAGIPHLPASTTGPSTLTEILLAFPKFPINVAPREIRAVAAARSLRTALLAGVGCAALLVGFEYIATGAQVSKDAAKLKSIKSAASAQSSSSQTLQKAIAAQAELAHVESRVGAALNNTPSFPAMLLQLSAEPAQIRLTSIELSSDSKSGHRATLIGRVLLSEVASPGSAINSFISDLANVPVVESARLGSAQRAQFDRYEVQNFEINLSLLGLPAPSLRRSPTLAEAHAP